MACTLRAANVPGTLSCNRCRLSSLGRINAVRVLMTRANSVPERVTFTCRSPAARFLLYSNLKKNSATRPRSLSPSRHSNPKPIHYSFVIRAPSLHISLVIRTPNPHISLVIRAPNPHITVSLFEPQTYTLHSCDSNHKPIGEGGET